MNGTQQRKRDYEKLKQNRDNHEVNESGSPIYRLTSKLGEHLTSFRFSTASIIQYSIRIPFKISVRRWLYMRKKVVCSSSTTSMANSNHDPLWSSERRVHFFSKASLWHLFHEYMISWDSTTWFRIGQFQTRAASGTPRSRNIGQVS
jgi:hypothetical protein